MNKQELEQAIRAANEAGARYRPVESIKPKVLANALAGFARGCPAGEAVALYDTTILSSGKTGFLVSTTAIYHDSFDFLLKKGGSKRLALDGLVGLEPDQELDFYQAVYADGSRQRLYLGKVYQNAVLPLLRVLLGAEPAAAPAPQPATEKPAAEKPAAEKPAAPAPAPKPAAPPAAEKPAPKPATPPAAEKPAPAPRPAAPAAPAPQPADPEPTPLDKYHQGIAAFRAGDWDKAFPLLKAVAPVWSRRKDDFPAAQAALGRMWEEGLGTGKDPAQAFLHYRIAGQAGVLDGMKGALRLGAARETLGADTAEQLLAWAAELAAPEIRALVPALEQKRDAARAKAEAEAAEKARRQERERLFEEGVAAGKAGDHEKELDLYRQAAELGSPTAAFNCGVMYATGEGTPKDETKASEWYRRAAELGSPKAQFNLAMRLRIGQGVEKDAARALEWMCKAAEAGHARAQEECGDMYRDGEGAPKDPARALSWYEKAAEQGDADGQFACGVCYDRGDGVAQDQRAAREWFRKAAEQGHTKAQVNLGILMFNGEGGDRDRYGAKRWFRQAADNGNETAVEILRENY